MQQRKQLSIGWINCNNNQQKIHKNRVLVGGAYKLSNAQMFEPIEICELEARAISTTAITPKN